MQLAWIHSENPVGDLRGSLGGFRMGYTLFALGGALLGLIGLLLMAQRYRSRRQAIAPAEEPVHLSPMAQTLKLQKLNRYWGYRIESHCRASSRLAGQQFPLEGAPPLPVQGCESTTCHCCLIGLPEQRQQFDRRSGQDRRRSIRLEESDRRAERPRRNSDLNSWNSYSHL